MIFLAARLNDEQRAYEADHVTLIDHKVAFQHAIKIGFVPNDQMYMFSVTNTDGETLRYHAFKDSVTRKYTRLCVLDPGCWS